jgi:hypothetical protein
VTIEELLRYVKAREAEPNRPPDAAAIYADGYEAGQRDAFHSLALVLDGRDPHWRSWIDLAAAIEAESILTRGAARPVGGGLHRAPDRGAGGAR